jgi:dinuclear metal center YbgI/SA1388 family protein
LSAKRGELVKYLDELLELELWEKIDVSLNGLQIEGANRISRIALAVDASEQTFRMCIKAAAQMLIVHHGLFWGKPLPLAGTHRRRIKLLLDSDISLYAAHLPLDFHPQLGHSACIARALGLEIKDNLTTESGMDLGTLAHAPEPLDLSLFVASVDRQLDTKSRVLPFGREAVERVGIISGYGSKILDEPLSKKIDTFLTGESSHTLYHFAKEFGVNVVFAGHYATEVPGLKELASHLASRFALETEFLQAPTGL